MPFQIFISHDSRDEDWAQAIADAVSNVGADPYLYETDPQPGRELSNKLKEEIQESELLIVLLTPNSRESSDVQQEVGFAEDKTPIVPIVHPEIETEDLGFILKGREYLPLYPDQPDQTLNQLMNHVQNQKQIKQEKRNQALIALAGIGAFLLSKSQNEN